MGDAPTSSAREADGIILLWTPGVQWSELERLLLATFWILLFFSYVLPRVEIEDVATYSAAFVSLTLSSFWQTSLRTPPFPLRIPRQDCLNHYIFRRICIEHHLFSSLSEGSRGCHWLHSLCHGRGAK